MKEAMPTANETKKVKDKTERLRCPLSLLIFFDPVTASDGHTYEREEIEEVLNGANPVSPITREVLTKVLIPNHDKRGAVLEYLEEHPELYEQGEVYLSKKLKQQLVTAIQEENPKGLAGALQKDPRLIKAALNSQGETCLSLSCGQTSPDVLKVILNKLPTTEVAELRKPSTMKTFELLGKVALNMKAIGLEIWCEALNITPAIAFFSSLSFCAVSLKDLELLKACAEKININLVETENKRSLLHRAVITCAESMKEKNSIEVPHELVAIIKYLFSKNIDPKLKDSGNMTAAELAAKLGYPMLMSALETERRRAKLLPFIAPLQESQAQLLADVRRLAAENTHLRSALENTQEKLAALSSAFTGAEIQKIEKAFKPHVCKTYTQMGEISGITMVGEHHMVTVSSDPSGSRKNKLCIWDLTKPANASCIKTLEVECGNGFKKDNDIFALDNTQFVFIEKRGISHSQQKPTAKFVLWNVVTNQEEKSFEVDCAYARIIHVINPTTIFFSCSPSQSNRFHAALLDLTTGKVTPHENSEIKDDPHTNFASNGMNSQLVYLSKERRSESQGLYLYNSLTKQTTLLASGDDFYGFDAYSGLLKFIAPNLIAIRCGNHREKKSVRLFDIKTQQFVQSFAHAKIGTGWQEEFPMVLGISAAGTNKVATVAVVKRNFQLIIWDMQNGTAKHQLEIPAESTENPIPMAYDAYRDLLYVVSNHAVNAIQLNPNLTNTHAVTLSSSPRFKK